MVKVHLNPQKEIVSNIFRFLIYCYFRFMGIFLFLTKLTIFIIFIIKFALSTVRRAQSY